MARRRDPGQKEYNPLDDAKGRFPLESMRELVREATATASPAAPAPPMPGGGEERTAPSATLAEPAAVVKAPGLEKLTQYNKFLTTPTEKLELERLAARVSGALGVSVRPSHLIRACLIQLLHAEQEIIARAERHGRLKRPSNTEAVALAEFDHAVAEILSDAFRQAGPLQSRS
jgi:hypothetical protein